MKKRGIYILGLACLLGAVVWWWGQPVMVPTDEEKPVSVIEPQSETSVSEFQDAPKRSEWMPPLNRASERVTKKPFGIFIDPQTSPVQPERFRGYHTGTDFEIFSDEAAFPVTVSAVCAGEIVEKRWASGYGGIVVERCHYEGESIIVVYGHLDLSTVNIRINESVKAGEALGALGADGSVDTDGERKHLHLGLYRGTKIDIRGYVLISEDLSSWLDPCRFVCQP